MRVRSRHLTAPHRTAPFRTGPHRTALRAHLNEPPPPSPPFPSLYTPFILRWPASVANANADADADADATQRLCGVAVSMTSMVGKSGKWKCEFCSNVTEGVDREFATAAAQVDTVDYLLGKAAGWDGKAADAPLLLLCFDASGSMVCRASRARAHARGRGRGLCSTLHI